MILSLRARRIHTPTEIHLHLAIITGQYRPRRLSLPMMADSRACRKQPMQFPETLQLAPADQTSTLSRGRQHLGKE